MFFFWVMDSLIMRRPKKFQTKEEADDAAAKPLLDDGAGASTGQSGLALGLQSRENKTPARDLKDKGVHAV